MKILETAGKATKAATARVVGAVAAAVRPSAEEEDRPRDPWYYDTRRRADFNSAGGRWLPRRPGWLRV